MEKQLRRNDRLKDERRAKEFRETKDKIEKQLEFVKATALKILKEEKKNPALKARSPESLLQEIEFEIPECGRSLGDLYELLEKVLLNTPRTASNRFFNQLFGGRTMPAVAAEMLTAFTNVSMYTYKVAGVQVLIEREVVRTLCDYVGFREGEGTLVPGGSISNLVAMVLARNEKDTSIRNLGLNATKFAIYTSEESHYSITKNAGLLGFGSNCVRKIAVDERGRMRPSELRGQIQKDQASGIVPLLVNATAGTTVLGAFDPVEALIEIAKEASCWLHVDGAFGGSVLLSRKHRGLLKGCAEADSFSWNAHKMMGVPLTASVILVREKGCLERSFSEEAAYLFQSHQDEMNPGKFSIQCGRRNDGLKIWTALQYFGKRGYEERTNRLMGLAQYAAELIREDPALDLVMSPDSVNVCFEVIGHSSELVCSDLDKLGIAKIGFGTFRNRSFIRLVCVDASLTKEDLRSLLGDIKSAASQL